MPSVKQISVAQFLLFLMAEFFQIIKPTKMDSFSSKSIYVYSCPHTPTSNSINDINKASVSVGFFLSKACIKQCTKEQT